MSHQVGQNELPHYRGEVGQNELHRIKENKKENSYFELRRGL